MIRLIAAAACLVVPCLSAGAEDMPDLDDIVTVSLIDGWQNDAQNRVGALRVDLAEGWKTYWRVAGETGLPPVFDWSASENLKGVSYHWPRPQVISVDGIKILGYSGQLVLPIEFEPIDPALPVVARANLDMGVCRDVCVPVHADLDQRMEGKDNGDRILIDISLTQLPETASGAGLRSISCILTPNEDGYNLSARIDLPASVGPDEIVVFETGVSDIWIAPTKTLRDGSILLAQTELVNYSGKTLSLNPANFRISVVGQDRAVDISGCPDGT